MIDFGIINFGAFLVASILLNLTPGVDTLYVLGRSVTGGPQVGIASALGISGGLVVHTVLVAFGLSVVLMSSAWLFWAFKLFGACYLVFLGIRAFTSKGGLAAVPDELASTVLVNRKLGRTFIQGVITNVMNPKVALFFLAFLPQFVDASVASGPVPFLALGLCFITTSTIWSIILALGAGQFKKLTDRHPRLSVYTNRAAGLLYIILGIGIFSTPMPD